MWQVFDRQLNLLVYKLFVEGEGYTEMIRKKDVIEKLKSINEDCGKCINETIDIMKK